MADETKPHRIRQKEPHEIRPAAGVKMKRKNPPPQVKRGQEKPKVVHDIAQDKPGQELPIPSEEAIKVIGRLNEAKQSLMEHMKAFNKLLSVNVLSENRSVREKEEEQKVINELVLAALNVENLNAGEGLLGMCVLAIRQGLSLRDAGNRLAYKVSQLEQEMEKLKKECELHSKSAAVKDPSEIAKRELLKRAEQLGLKLSFEE